MKGDPLKFRYRTNWRGQLILQVLEEAFSGDVTVSYGPLVYGRWRDALAQDITRTERQPKVAMA